MTTVRLVTRSAKGQIRNTSARPAAIGQEGFQAAFPNARTVGPVPGDSHDPYSLLQVAGVVDRTLRAIGKQAGLADTGTTPLRVALLAGDQAKIESIRTTIAEQARLRPSAEQVVAVLCHLALAHIPEDELSASLGRLAELAKDVH